ncbi:hypothetical protein NGF19_12680 [Streptomyces sp. RY43-2]|uniref:Uncharacterized protein n=1 Tax=Streptomyces macrolidinus TaxID=2952607 RepID=A0ABT0ZDJ6_9ACTN|nr:hypothetical protein [Streptomyces macrolidinus]MCN9241638.1 hypothetical protein [Streptomyces macrolidinus]
MIGVGYRGDLDRALRRRGLNPFCVVQPSMGVPEEFKEEAALVFGECAIRLPGGLSSQDDELTYGVHLLDAEVSALGAPPTRMGHGGTRDTPTGPYGWSGRAIVSDPDESEPEKRVRDTVRFNVTNMTRGARRAVSHS